MNIPKMSLQESHIKFLQHEVIVIPHPSGLVFNSSNYDFTKYTNGFTSKTNPCLLSRQAYLRRDEIIDDVRNLDHLIRAAQTFSSPGTLTIQAIPDKSWFLPKIVGVVAKGEGGMEIKSSEKFIAFAPDKICLFPGRISQGNYIAYSLDEIIDELDKKSNYASDQPLVDLTSMAGLANLKEVLIKYIRDRIRLMIKRDPSNPRLKLYRLDQDETPLEAALRKILAGEDLNEVEKCIYTEFPLIYTNLTDKVTVYLREDLAIIDDANKFFPEMDHKKLMLVNPVLVSEVKTDLYNIPVSVEMRALHVNYAYEMKDETYEDYLGEPNLIMAPLCLEKSGNVLNGYLSHPSYVFSSVKF